MSGLDFFVSLIGLASSAVNHLISSVLSTPAFIIPFSITFGGSCIYFVYRGIKR